MPSTDYREFEPLKIDPTGRYFIRLTEDNLIEIKGPRGTTKGHFHISGCQMFTLRSTGLAQPVLTSYILSFTQWKNPNYLSKKKDEDVIDHIDSNRLNSHPFNLQKITQRENAMKAFRRTEGLPQGVHRFRNRYGGLIWFNGCVRKVGWFDNPEDAHRKYMEAYRFIKTHSDEEIEEMYPAFTRKKELRWIHFCNREKRWMVVVRNKYVGRFLSIEDAMRGREEYLLTVENGTAEKI